VRNDFKGVSGFEKRPIERKEPPQNIRAKTKEEP